MQEFIIQIFGESDTFTAGTILTMFTLCLILDCIASIAENVTKGGR